MSYSFAMFVRHHLCLCREDISRGVNCIISFHAELLIYVTNCQFPINLVNDATHSKEMIYSLGLAVSYSPIGHEALTWIIKSRFSFSHSFSFSFGSTVNATIEIQFVIHGWELLSRADRLWKNRGDVQPRQRKFLKVLEKELQELSPIRNNVCSARNLRTRHFKGSLTLPLGIFSKFVTCEITWNGHLIIKII